MPQIIPFVVTAITAVTSAVVAAGPWAVAAFNAANVIGAAALANEAFKAIQPQVKSSSTALEWNADANAPNRFAFGRVGGAGNIIHNATYGPDKMFVGFVGVMSASGPIKSWQAFKADDAFVSFNAAGKAINTEYANEMYLGRQRGLQPEPSYLPSPSGLKNGAAMPRWGASYKLSGKAAYMYTLQENSKRSAFKGKVPTGIHYIEGLYCYDPRFDSTYPGGTGPCRIDDPTTWVYSTNAYIHALNWNIGRWEGEASGFTPARYGVPYASMKVGGIGATPEGIDFSGYVEAANVFDENAWACAAWPDADQSKAAVLDSFLQAGGGIYAERQGKISCLHRAAPRTSVVTITADDTAGTIEYDTTTSLLERINTIRPEYWSEAHGWQMVATDEVTSDVWREEDGQGVAVTRSKGLAYNYVPQSKQARELAALQIAHTREGIRGTAPLRHYLDLEVGDCFTFEVPEAVLNGQKCIVLNVDPDLENDIINVTFASESDGKYPFAFGQADAPPPAPALQPADNTVSPPLPGDWTITPRPPAPGGGQLPGFDLGGIVSNETATAVIVEYGLTATGPWTQAYQGPPTVTTIPIDGLQPGATYYIAVQYQRDQNYSERYVYGPYTAPNLEPSHLNTEPVQDVLDRLRNTADLADQNRQAVEALEEVYGDTASAAASAAAAAADAVAANQAKADAIIAKGEAQDARDEAAQKALDASGSAAASAGSASAADDARAAAVIAKGEAQGAASDAAADALVAAQKAGEALGSANSAAGSAAVASTKADEAGTAAAASLASSVTATTAKDAALAAAIAGFPDVLAPDLLTSSRNRSPEDAPSLNPAWFSAEGITSPVSAQAEVYYKQTVPWKSGEVYEFDFEVEGITGVSSAAVLGPYQNAANTNVTTRSGPYVVTPNGVKTRIVQRIALDRTLAGATTWPLGTWNADRLRFGVAVNALTGGDANPRQARLTRMTVRNVTALVAAEKVRDDTILLGGNQGFEEGLTGWTRGITTTQSPITTWHSSYEGRSGVSVTEGGPRAQHYSAKLFPVDPSRKYRFRASVFVGAGGPSRVYAGFRNLDASGQALGSNSGHRYVVIPGSPVLPENSGWVDRVSDVYTGEAVGGLTGKFETGTRLVQLVAFLNYDQAAETQTALDGIWIEDVTESVNAQDAATASATSAASAAASETAAGQFASASDAARQQAQTARAGAEAAQSSAADSATTATGAAATATQQAGLATTAKNASEAAAAASVDARDQASSFADDAEVSAGASSAASVTAEAARQAAEAAQGAAEDARDQSQTAAQASAGSASTAAASETAAGQFASASEAAKTQAETARGQAQTAATQAADSRDTAEGHAASASASAALAADSEDAAAGAAIAAAGSASTADTKAGEAGVSAAAAQAASVSATAAKEDAEASATASASSASSAAASETASGQSASAAQAAKIDAETARAQAQTFRNEAADAATDAEGAAATASSAAGQSVTAKDQAQGFANAANTSAQNAAGSATASGNSAAAANTAKTAAEAAYGGAVGAAIATMPDVIAADLLTRVGTGSPETSPSLPSGVSGGVWTTGASDNGFYFKGVIPWVQGRIYEWSLTIEGLTEPTAGGPAYARMFGVRLGSDYTSKGSFSPAANIPTPVSEKTVLTGRAGMAAGVPSLVNIPGEPGDWVRFGAIFDRIPSGASKAPGATSKVYALTVRDITASFNAASSATASATSAASAAASATQAGEKAIAAQASATAADTSRGQAQTAASQASEAETNAAGSAATASTAAQNAADSRDQASGFATAASGSASTASTKATEAGNAAAAAQASQVSASAAKEAAEDARDDAETAKGQAQASATASATQASNAAASATTAGEKATAAAGSATTAATKAGDASAFANQAAGSASDAAGSAVTASQASGTSVSARDAAIGARNDAQAAAATAVAQSSSASASAAAASISADLAAKVGHQNEYANADLSQGTYGFTPIWGFGSANPTVSVVNGGEAIRALKNGGSFDGMATRYGIVALDGGGVSKSAGGAPARKMWPVAAGERIGFAVDGRTRAGSARWYLDVRWCDKNGAGSTSLGTAETAHGNTAWQRFGVVRTAPDDGYVWAEATMILGWDGSAGIADLELRRPTFARLIASATDVPVFSAPAGGGVLSDLSASLNITAAVAASADGTAKAIHGVVMDVNGYVSGYGSVNDGVTSAFEVLAANFAIRDPGSGERTEYRSGNWYVYSPSENTRTRYGKAFGGTQKLVWWTGPTSVAEGSETKANAYVYMSQNTVSGPRLGGSDIVGGSGVLTATASSLIVQGGRNGAGGVSTSTTTVTAAGGNSGASIRWVKVSGDDLVANSPSSFTTSFYGTVGTGQSKSAVFMGVVTKAGQQAAVYVQADIADNGT